jgi:hypothetical protein
VFTVPYAGPKAMYMTQQRYLSGLTSSKGGNELNPKAKVRKDPRELEFRFREKLVQVHCE